MNFLIAHATKICLSWKWHLSVEVSPQSKGMIMRGWMRLFGSFVLMVAMFAAGFVRPVSAVTARWGYETAYVNVNDGDWYKDYNNENATLAWGQSYVMMSLCAMFRATGDPMYLERLIRHLDGVLAQRDDVRGVTDYRGVSGACWRNMHYQPNDEPYCYVVHSGMIAFSLAEFARLAAVHGLEEEIAYDGMTFGEKAALYIAAAEETVAFHEDQWNPEGYYIFRSDASFLNHPGRDLPLNMSNAMGRLLVVLHEVTGDSGYLAKAQALAQRFASFLAVGAQGEYLWNYWGGAYSAPGEDISHAAINVGFAALAAEYGVVFDSQDMEAFAATFVYNVYIDDRTFADRVGGGGMNNPSYAPQAGRWLTYSRFRPTIYAAVRDFYELNHPPESVGSGSLLAGWGYLAEFEPVYCPHFFYYVDWYDPDPLSDDDWREATAYGANILTTPPDLAKPCLIPLQVDVPRNVTVDQWDGSRYHHTVKWQPTGGPASRFVPYEPRWPHIYWNDGVLYQFTDAFVSGNGIKVKENPGPAPPIITSTPPISGPPGVALSYSPQAEGDAPFWWSLKEFPVHARIHAETGELDFTPAAQGDYAFTILLENDFGADEQSFLYEVRDPDDPDASVEFDGSADGSAQYEDGSFSADADGDIREGTPSGGCSCRQASANRFPRGLPPAAMLLFFLLIPALRFAVQMSHRGSGRV